MRWRRRRRRRALERRGALADLAREWRKFELAPETRRYAASTLWLLVGSIAVLALFGSAGKVGLWVRPQLFTWLGWGAYVIPFVVTFLALTRFDPSRFPFSRARYTGVVLLIVTSLGLFHLPAAPSDGLVFVDEGKGGGYAGFLVTYGLRTAVGGPATVLVLLVLWGTGLALALNRTPGHFFAWLRARRLARARDRLAEGAGAPSAQEVGAEALAEDVAESELAEDLGDADGAEEDHAVGSERTPTLPLFTTRVLDGMGSRSATGSATLNLRGRQWARAATVPPYDPPPLTLLSDASTRPVSADIKVSQRVIQQTLETFGIQVEMGEVSVGPTVTQYTLKPVGAVKLSKIVALHNDLALALAAHPIRMEAPIPGKGLVGIEVPNKAVSIVRLRELLASPAFSSAQGALPFALGKDVSGQAVTVDLDRMPHLLIAGATGSGKSVLINCLLISLLYRNSPQALKLILVDPKRVELPLYDGIPHLLSPVIVEAGKAISALRWAVAEMDRRYELLNASRRRDLASYNRGRRAEDLLPRIVVVIDELADIMVRHAREMEDAVTRLAQIARAVGIHLVLATQRPSVDVITGLIKANITSRVAFKVASAIDARTILDTIGAEKLLGSGDMLFLASDHTKPRRLQGAYVSEDEVKRVAGYLTRTGEVVYDASVTSAPETEAGFSGDEDDAIDDTLYRDAERVVIEARRASTSLLQRRLRIGYSRAARIMDLLEKNGVIGPPDGARPREVLATGGGARAAASGMEPESDEVGFRDEESDAPEGSPRPPSGRADGSGAPPAHHLPPDDHRV